MSKKLFLLAVAFFAATLATTSASAQACDSGATLQFVGVGASAQFSTLAYAAEDVIAAEGSTYNLFSVKGAETSGYQTAAIQDVRVAGTPQDSATLWVMWDSNATCNVFAYYGVDATAGTRAFFASQLLTGDTSNSKSYPAAGVLPCLAGQGTEYPSAACQNTGVSLTTVGFCSGKCAQNNVGGLLDNAASDVLPSSVYIALTTPVVPQATTSTTPAAYCGQKYPAASTSAFYCYFNAAAVDSRPEDAYYATNRALAVPANGLTGQNYGNANCTLPGGTNCQVYDSFNQGGAFNALKFNITGKDPYKTTSAVPTYTTLNLGASPIIVFVSNKDTATGGLGSTYTDSNGRTSYLFNNILPQKLADIFQGSSHCSGDILPAAPLKCEATNAQVGCGIGTGKPLQVVTREPLAGAYQVFEYTAVRSLSGSAVTGAEKPSVTSWTSNDNAGQEVWYEAASGDLTNAAVYPWYVDPGAPAMGWSGGALASACGVVSSTGGFNKVSNPAGTQNCSNPLFIVTGSSSASTCGQGLRLRAVGGSLEVAAALGLENTGASTVTDGIGYHFWSYGNFAKATPTVGHYLTVNAIDPLFTTEGGYGFGATVERNDGLAAWTLPQCNLTNVANGTPCPTTIPFTHIYDGTYPLWSVLRIVTFQNLSATTTQTPPYVLDIAAYNQVEAASATRNTADFVPYLTNIANTGSLTAPVWTGDLNLGVFREHFKQTGGVVNPSNGHEACKGVFTGVSLQGGNTKGATCLVDTGNDVGGVVTTVQDDVDFILDFAGTTTEGVALSATYEEYGRSQ